MELKSTPRASRCGKVLRKRPNSSENRKFSLLMQKCYFLACLMLMTYWQRADERSILAFFNSLVPRTPQPGVSAAKGADGSTSKCNSLCTSKRALKQMCTADLGSTSQGTGHKCTCSPFLMKGQAYSERDTTFHSLCDSVCKYLGGF